MTGYRPRRVYWQRGNWVHMVPKKQHEQPEPDSKIAPAATIAREPEGSTP